MESGAVQKRVEVRRKSRKEKKKPRTAVLRPKADSLGRITVILGWILRGGLVCLGAYGLMLFLGDASGIISPGSPVSSASLLLSCAVGALLFGLLFAGTKGALASAIPLAGAGIGFAAVHGSESIRLTENAARCLYNETLTHLSTAGYTVMLNYLASERYSYARDILVRRGFCALAMLLTLTLALLIMRGVRPLLLGILCTGILVPVFVYNVTETNDGVAAVIIFVIGAMAMWLYDRRFGIAGERREAARHRREERRAKREASRRGKQQLRARAEAAMIAAYDRGGSRRDAVEARRAVIRVEKRREDGRRSAEKAARAKLVLSAAERKQTARLHRQSRCVAISGGGFAGAGGALLAALALLIPHALVEENFPVIPSLDRQVRIARLYTTAYLMGDDIDLNQLSVYGGVMELNPREVSFSSPRFTGERIFFVESGTNAPVYLRSWIGTEYDLENDSWHSAERDEVNAFRARFGADFTPDSVGMNFRRYIFPNSVNLSRSDLYRGYSDSGFVVAQTHIRRTGGTGRILFVPTYLNTDLGIMEYGSAEPNRYPMSSYFDGVYSSRFFAIPGRSYSVYSFITTMKNESLAERLAADQAYYALSLHYADYMDRLLRGESGGYMMIPTGEMVSLSDGHAEEKLLAAYEAQLSEMGVRRDGISLLARYREMSEEEKSAYRAACALEEEYRAYVYEQYTGSIGSGRVAELAVQILADRGWSRQENTVTDGEGNEIPLHRVVLAVLGFLRGEPFVYSLTPRMPQSTPQSTLDAFLFDTHEGYCVHFATAAAAILREYGLAVRYAEGYVASGFERNSRSAAADYYTSVYDYNAHAWIEVYYPYMGWMQYEATPSYMSAMYDSDTDYSTVVALPDDFLEEEEEEEEELLEILLPESLNYTALILSGCALLLLLAGLAVYLLIRRGRIAYESRCNLIMRSKSGVSEEERIPLARKLNDAMLAVFARLDCPPEVGELSGDYGARLEVEVGDVSVYSIRDILPITQKAEFGTSLSAAELRMLGEYLEEMTACVYTGLSYPRRFLMRCIYQVL